MRTNRIISTGIGIWALLLASCATNTKPTPKVVQKSKTTVTKPTTTKPVNTTSTLPKSQEIKVNLPTINREFRGAWVATVANINWPSKGNYSTDIQKNEAIRILDQLKEANFNAVIFQVRPSADALYESQLEPWSYFLTGQQGKAPSPYYDPLKFWIEEAHQRGMELHIWLNPYRAHHSSGGAVTSASMASKMKDKTYRLRNGMYWMDPSDETVQNHASAVIKDLVKRYDIDAVHIDDYFYPYREYNGGKDFPDTPTWTAYLNSGGTLSKADWRRANVNKFIKRIHTEIKATKSWVRFGISPFGIWKPGYPSGIKGSSQYDELYADAKLWLNEGWCDYFSPQLYWKDGGAQSFSALLQWWEKENKKGIHLWPGLNTIGIRNVADKSTEINHQISLTRSITPNSKGAIHYSVDGVIGNHKMYNSVRNTYSEKALIPATSWIKSESLLKPELTAKASGNSVIANWFSRNSELITHWVLFAQYGSKWETHILHSNQKSMNLPTSKAGEKLTHIAVKSIDRLGKESDYRAVKIQ